MIFIWWLFHEDRDSVLFPNMDSQHTYVPNTVRGTWQATKKVWCWQVDDIDIGQIFLLIHGYQKETIHAIKEKSQDFEDI